MNGYAAWPQDDTYDIVQAGKDLGINGPRRDSTPPSKIKANAKDSRGELPGGVVPIAKPSKPPRETVQQYLERKARESQVLEQGTLVDVKDAYFSAQPKSDDLLDGCEVFTFSSTPWQVFISDTVARAHVISPFIIKGSDNE